ncbi:MAG: polysaccharide biosynthesis C-terminal domain-containing protein [Bacteroidia bacterium]
MLTHKEQGSFDLRWFIYTQTFAYALVAFITLIIVLKKAHVRRLYWRWPFFMMILKKSYPYAVLVLLMSFYNRIDSVMLERLLPFRIGANEAGIYASAYRLLDAANMIAFLFAGLLLPIFARMIKLKQNVEEMVVLSFSLLVIPALVVAICSYFFSYDLMNMLYTGDHIEESATVFKILMCCFVPISTSYIFGTLLTANGSMRQLNIMASTGMIINIGLNFYLIPKYSAAGAAISSISTQLFTSAAQVIMSKKLFDFKTNINLIGKVLFFILFCIGVSYFSHQLNLPWMVRFIIAAGTCMVAAFGLRIINLKNIYHIIKYGE